MIRWRWIVYNQQDADELQALGGMVQRVNALPSDPPMWLVALPVSSVAGQLEAFADLLAACREAFNWYNTTGDVYRRLCLELRVIDAQIAIAKARGES